MGKSYVKVIDGDRPGWRYGSGIAIYTERFVDGRLLSAAYQDNGVPVYPMHENTDVPAFDLVIDGEALYFGWELESSELSSEGDTAVGVLTLRHSRKPVTLGITTRACGHGFFRRSIEITNTSADASLGLTSFTPMQGALWNMQDNLRDNLNDRTVHPYSVGHFRDFHWGNEGNFGWQDIALNTRVAYGSYTGRSGHSMPFFVLRNNLYGGYFVCHLGWSANWETSFFSDFRDESPTVRLKFACRPVAAPPMRVIAPGETISAPDVHFGLSGEDLDTAIKNLHGYLRESVLRKVGDGLQPIIYNHWGYMEHEISEAGLIAEIDIAAEVGAELFMVDAGWFGNKGAEWGKTTGDWTAGDRLPNDLFPVFEHARKKDLKCGLWVEIESAGADSKVSREHPDWFVARYAKTVERVLDLAKPVVQDYVESEVVRIIERYKLDMFRLDYNVAPDEGGFNNVAGLDENTLWRHVEAIQGIFRRVGERFPNLQLETCASGGGRTDLGMVGKFTTTWVSDWMRMPRTVRILNGMSMALPPEYINRLFGAAMGGSYRGSIDAQMHVIILGHPTVSGLTPSLAEANPELMETVKKYLGLYKNFIRPFHREARVYHHTPVIEGSDGTGWCALEYVSDDRQKAVAAVFRLVNSEDGVYRLKFKGLDPAIDYEMTFEPGGDTTAVGGIELMQTGIEISLDSALTSRLILLSALA
jgi:alpha-galactosidase